MHGGCGHPVEFHGTCAHVQLLSLKDRDRVSAHLEVLRRSGQGAAGAVERGLGCGLGAVQGGDQLAVAAGPTAEPPDHALRH